MSRRMKIGWGVAVGYFALVIVVQAWTELSLFDMRELDRNLVDYAWQLELIHAADLGRWSGRDFGYARGPLFQLLAYWSSRPGPIDPARTFATMHALYKVLSVLLAFLVVQSQMRSWRSQTARLVAFIALAVLAYGVGISTFRALLSALVIVSYLPAVETHEAPPWKSAVLTAAILLLALVHSFDRLLLGWTSIAALTAYELFSRWRRSDRPRVAVVRMGRVTAVFAVGLAALALVGWLFGFHMFDYFAGQARVASGYRSLFGTWSPEVRSQNTVGLLVGALLISLALAFNRSGRWRLGAWIFAAIPLATFAVGIPDRGHIYVGLLPLVVVLVLIPFHGGQAAWVRWTSGILASVFALGWFGAFPGDLWASPQTFGPAIDMARGRTRHTEFVTDFGDALQWARSRPKERGCLVINPAMAVIHALADVPGPTLLRLRWTLDDGARLAADIRQARCANYIHQLRSFDDIQGAEWQLGEDWLTLAELYGNPRQISAATFTLALRSEPRAAVRELLSPTAVEESVVTPHEIRIPLGRPIENDSIVLLDYRLEADGIGPVLGKLPEIDYRFERSGRALSEPRPMFHVEANHAASAHLAVDAEAVEWRWLLGKRIHRSETADTLLLRFSAHGLLTPRRFRFVVSRLTALSSGAPLVADVARACESHVDLASRVSDGSAFARNVAPRPTDAVIHMHTNPPGWHLAEVFAPLRPCADTCLYAELGLGSSADGDGVSSEIHVVDRDKRPLLVSQRLSPGDPLVRVELPLWPWKDSDILLRFASLPGKSHDGDFAFIRQPRIATCGGRSLLADAVRQGRGKLTGKASASGDDLEFAKVPGHLSYPFRVTRDTCLHQAFEVSGDGPARWLFETYVRVDEVDHRLLRQRIEGKNDTRQSFLVSLHDWDGRDVELVLTATPEHVPGGEIAFIRRPRLASCAIEP